jgi:hypothetical protein
MSSSQAHIALLIDIFDLAEQPARVLPKIKPPQLVEAIIQEFRDIEYLADDPAQYYLARAGDEAPLDEGVELGGQQLAPGARLVLRERDPAAPDGAQLFSQRIYLREQRLGKVYRLVWQPAVIGRRVESPSHGDAQPVAVDLQPFATGLRVSRRHLSIGESDGELTVENLSNNPALIQRAGGLQLSIESGKIPLRGDDIILLERSQIALKVLLFPKAGPAAPGDLEAMAVGEAATTGLQSADEADAAEEN